MIGMPALAQRLAAQGAAALRSEVERNPSGGTEATHGHGGSLAPPAHGADGAVRVGQGADPSADQVRPEGPMRNGGGAGLIAVRKCPRPQQRESNA